MFASIPFSRQSYTYLPIGDLQVFLGGEDFMEDLNFRDGKRKEQLVRDDKWASNDAAGGWTDEQASLDCASGCKVPN